MCSTQGIDKEGATVCSLLFYTVKMTDAIKLKSALRWIMLNDESLP